MNKVEDTLNLIRSQRDPYLLEIDKNGSLKERVWLSYAIRKILSAFIGSDNAFSNTPLLSIAKNLEHIFFEHQSTLDKSDALEFQDYFLLLKEKAKGNTTLQINKISQGVFNKVTIQPKLKLVNRAIKHLNKNDSSENVVSNSAKTFFLRLKARLERQENVCLPDWYHATKAKSINSILQEGKIKQHHAIKGYGSYVSSNDEGGEVIGYGPYTIAFDGTFFERTKASFFVPNPDHHLTGRVFNWFFQWPHSSIWARVEKDIPINKNTVAYLIANNEYLPELKEITKTHQPELFCISREASQKIFSTLVDSQPLKKLPKQWVWMKGETLTPLPKVFVQN